MPINELGEHVESDHRKQSLFEGEKRDHELETGVFYPHHMDRLEEVMYNSDAVRAHRQMHERNNPLYRTGVM